MISDDDFTLEQAEMLLHLAADTPPDEELFETAIASALLVSPFETAAKKTGHGFFWFLRKWLSIFFIFVAILGLGHTDAPPLNKPFKITGLMYLERDLMDFAKGVQGLAAEFQQQLQVQFNLHSQGRPFLDSSNFSITLIRLVARAPQIGSEAWATT